MEENKDTCMLLTGKLDGKRLLGRPIYIDGKLILKSSFKDNERVQAGFV
jgi:hypothetical protein